MKHIDVGESREILLALYQDIRMIFKQFGYEQVAGSPADDENKLIGEPQGITGILSQVWILWEASSDHVLAAIKTLSEPVQTIAPFGCVRAAMEVAARSCWILDPSIDYKRRLARSFALEWKGLDEYSKLTRESPKSADERLQERYEYFKKKTLEYKLPKESLPSATDLICNIFGDRSYYRVSSAVTHGQIWALMEVGYIQRNHDHENGLMYLHEAVKPNLLMYLIALALEALGRPTWALAFYVGMDRMTIMNVLDKAYDKLQMSRNRRFWLE
jgi:hypothetical protein